MRETILARPWNDGAPAGNFIPPFMVAPASQRLLASVDARRMDRREEK